MSTKYRIFLHLNLCIFICLTSKIFSQEITFEWSKYFETKQQGMLNPEIFLASENGFVVYSLEKNPIRAFDNDIYITSFNFNCIKNNEIKVVLPKIKGREANYLKVIETKTSLIICSYLALKGGDNTLFAQIFNVETNTISDPIELVSFPIEKTSNSGDFLIDISEDKQTVGVVSHLPFIKKEKETVSYHVFDSQLKAISKAESLVINYPSKKSYKETIYISNNKNALLTKDIDKNKSTFTTTVLTISTDRNIRTIQLPNKEFYVLDHKIVITPNGEFMVGFATDTWKNKVITAEAKSKIAFIYDLKAEKIVAKHAWSKEVLKKFLGKGFTNLILKDVIVDKDAIYLIGDRYKEDATAIPEKSFEYNYTYFNGPGIAVKFNLTGELQYESYFDYSQRFVNRWQQIASFYPTVIDEKLHLFSSINMMALSDKLITVNNFKYTLNNTILDAQGKQETNPIFDNAVGGKKSSLNFCPTTLIRATENTFYIKAIGSDHQSFGKMIITNN